MEMGNIEEIRDHEKPVMDSLEPSSPKDNKYSFHKKLGLRLANYY